MAFLLGIDVSTTATKALLVDTQGEAISSGTTGYEFRTPRPLWAEQDPALWWNGTIASVREVLAASRVRPAEIAAIGLTGQMHGMTFLSLAVRRACS